MTRGIRWRAGLSGVFFGMAVLWSTAMLPPDALAEDAAGQDVAGKIMTVLGPIAPSAAGVTLSHEHLFIDFTLPLDEPERWILAERTLPRTKAEMDIWNLPISLDRLAVVIRNIWGNRDALVIDDLETVQREVAAFRRAGGGTIVDLTSIGLGRDPLKLATLSRRSGVNVVMGSGWYRRAWHPDDLGQRSVESLTAEIVRDVTIGVGDTGIRAGIIGEVSAMEIVTDPEDSTEVRALRAAARASRITGAAISLHQWIRDGSHLPRTLDILEAEGANLSRVIVGHMDAVSARDIDYLEMILERGVSLGFDLFGTPYYIAAPHLDDRPLADAIVDLVQRGYVDRILVSHDVCTKVQQQAYGGKGFDHIILDVVPYLKSRGLSDADLRRIMVDNPARLLTLAPPELSQNGALTP
ncbi:MAG: aryldialkylphosphatase [Sphingomonadales bacterium]